MKTARITLSILVCGVLFLSPASETSAQVAGQYYQIVNNVSKMALVTNGQTAKGSTVYKKDWSMAGDGSLWVFAKKGEYFAIKNKHSGMFLAAMQAKNRGDVIKITDTLGPGALWTLEQDDDNMFTLTNKANGLVIANMKDTEINSPARFNIAGGPGTKWMLVRER